MATGAPSVSDLVDALVVAHDEDKEPEQTAAIVKHLFEKVSPPQSGPMGLSAGTTTLSHSHSNSHPERWEPPRAAFIALSLAAKKVPAAFTTPASIDTLCGWLGAGCPSGLKLAVLVSDLGLDTHDNLP